MIVYKCVVTGDELFTDTYAITEADGLYKLKGKYVTRSKDNIDESLIGGNASAEDPSESAVDDPGAESGCNIILDNRLLPTAFGLKKEFTAYFKDYLKKLEQNKLEKEPETDVAAWRAEMTAAFKALSSNFKDYEFFTGESGNPDGSLAYLRWETPEGETDEVPFVYFFKEGLKEEKC